MIQTRPTKSERHTDLRHTITRIARTILKTEGLEALQARRIATEAGISVGTLYNACGNLDRIVLAANTESLDELGDTLRKLRVFQMGIKSKREHDGPAVANAIEAAVATHGQRLHRFRLPSAQYLACNF